MHGLVVKYTRYGLLCYTARVYIGKDLYKSHGCMSEQGARSWLAAQGIKVTDQVSYVAHLRSK